MSSSKKNIKPPKMRFGGTLNLDDERIPKIVGLLLILFSFYLFISFVSYIFTWKADQSYVDKYGIVLLILDVPIANWLGNLGALVSHQFIYWWFGIPSFIFILLFVVTGISLLKQTPVNRLINFYKYTLMLMLWLSIFCEFLFPRSTFPWGGSFGEAINAWLVSFLGVVGLIAFQLFTFLAYIIWVKNPDFKALSFENIRTYIKEFFTFETLKDIFYPRRELSHLMEDEDKPIKNNKTTNIPSSENEHTSENDTPPTKKEDKGARIREEVETQMRVKEAKEKRQKEIEEQLALELENPIEDPKALKAGGDSDLEIEIPIEEESIETEIDNDYKEPELDISKETRGVSTEPYDPTLELSAFENPVLSLLENYDDQKIVIDRTELEANKDQIINTLLHYKIEITKIKATIGPTVTLYEIIPAPGVRISKIKNLEDDIALSLAALGIRIIAPIPGRGTIGIEVPNKNKQIVALREVLASEKFRRAQMDLPIVLGKTISNEVMVVDLAKMPHLLIAGATGQGKSVGVNTILMSLLYKKHPSQLKLVLVDPKKVELSLYNRLSHHYLAFLPGEEEGIVTDTSKVIQTLHSLTIEMDERYNLLKKANVRNLGEYNEKFTARRLNPEKGHRYLPFIVLIIDEFADLIMTAGKEIELPIGRLAQLARAVGIHLIIATQRPSVNIITGVIKANFPARIAFKVSSKIDSRTILDTSGADQLVGRGDMLLSAGGAVVRVQGAFLDTPEVERIVDFIADQKGFPEPYYLPEFQGDEDKSEKVKVLEDIDEFFADSARLVVQNQQGSTSMIQRRLKLGYNRAGRIMDQLEAAGIVGPTDGSKPREVYIADEVELEKFLKKILKK